MHICVFMHHSSVKGARSEDKDGARQAPSSNWGTFMEANADGNVVTDLCKCPDIWVCY